MGLGPGRFDSAARTCWYSDTPSRMRTVSGCGTASANVLRQLAHGLQAPRLAVLRARMCSSTAGTRVNRSAGEPPSDVARTRYIRRGIPGSRNVRTHPTHGRFSQLRTNPKIQRPRPAPPSISLSAGSSRAKPPRALIVARRTPSVARMCVRIARLRIPPSTGTPGSAPRGLELIGRSVNLAPGLSSEGARTATLRRLSR